MNRHRDMPGQLLLVPADFPGLVLRCAECGRPLSSARSKKRRRGPTCHKRAKERAEIARQAAGGVATRDSSPDAANHAGQPAGAS